MDLCLKMKHLLMLFVTVLFFSCQFFDAEKISSETFYQEELKTINWEDVDRYPSFAICEGYTEKATQKECFESTLISYLQASLKNKDLTTYSNIYKTIWLKFIISEKGEIIEQEISIDSSLQRDFPKLKQWVLASMDSIPSFTPAYKRGVPIKTHFTLPVVIKTLEEVTN